MVLRHARIKNTILCTIIVTSYFQVCSQKGFICEVCQKEEILFPFDEATFQVLKEFIALSEFNLIMKTILVSVP